MTPTALAAFLLLAAECTPRTVDGRPIVAPETLASVVRTESNFAALSVSTNINGVGTGSPRFSTAAEASAFIDRSLAVNPRASLDIGLTQINNRAGHMQRRGLPLAAALDGCTAIRVGSEVLRECYRTAPARDEQARLAEAASCYNAGNHTRGLARERGGNGYVTRVQASAEVVVPAIRLRGEAIAPVAPVPAVPRPAVSLPLLNLLQPDVPSASSAAPTLQQTDEVP